MSFDALTIAHQVIAQLRSLDATIAAADPDLARQMRRAATSVPLNLSEGRQRAGKDRKHLWRVAAGSTAEVTEAPPSQGPSWLAPHLTRPLPPSP